MVTAEEELNDTQVRSWVLEWSFSEPSLCLLFKILPEPAKCKEPVYLKGAKKLLALRRKEITLQHRAPDAKSCGPYPDMACSGTQEVTLG
jgi:hypothetical protein